MPENTMNFRVSLLGLNRTEVEEYIEDIYDEKEVKLKNIKHKINELESENKTLEEELHALNKEMELEMKSEEFMTYAIKKADEWTQLIKAMAKEKAVQMEICRSSQEEIINNKIIECGEIIKNSKENLNELLSKEIKKNTELIQDISKFIDEKNKCINNIKEENKCKAINLENIKIQDDEISRGKIEISEEELTKNNIKKKEERKKDFIKNFINEKFDDKDFVKEEELKEVRRIFSNK
ncbi:hypothetical protein [Clostridium ganghwense]|uniref:Uncharacterized protein n=1 Tax=Clostridium ganghwense TaxID=312089 RepID=A0ABT4CS59_9CLOT|nr:hypothetical protein [Clostridium ganghwense]MCY6371051.1 hypothetical protein [Clostridium ganghwense]